MRIIKDPEVRRAEILDAAERLFVTKGYSQTTIIDILNEIGIAKGTFYYYFKSKGEVMDAIIMRIVSAGVAAAKKIADAPGIPAIDKLFMILTAGEIANAGGREELVEQFHEPANAEMHQKSLIQVVTHITPILAQVVEQGIRERRFQTDYPYETVEILFAAAEIIFDNGLFNHTPDEAERRMKAFIAVMELALGAETGSFGKMMDILA